LDHIELIKTIQDLDLQKYLTELDVYEECRLCPRDCGVNRLLGEEGYCRSDASFTISSICNHMGEEPTISGDRGICNIFFTNCNLQCVFCQNYQISRNTPDYSEYRMDFRRVLLAIADVLRSGMNIIGFVSPGHVIPQVRMIIRALRDLGLDPVFVYNSNGYDKAETLRSLEGMIDVYLPDFKYSDSAIADEYSGAADYPEIALRALKEMHRQIGSGLITGNDGYALRGIIIRHLVMPGHPENSIEVLRTIAEQVSPKLHISLMSQYHPIPFVSEHRYLRRTVSPAEYRRVTEAMAGFGFNNGYIQELSSAYNYNPDFRNEKPFD